MILPSIGSIYVVWNLGDVLPQRYEITARLTRITCPYNKFSLRMQIFVVKQRLAMGDEAIWGTPILKTEKLCPIENRSYIGRLGGFVTFSSQKDLQLLVQSQPDGGPVGGLVCS